MRIAALAFSALLAASALCQAGQVTVVNGGFETGDFSGWTLTGPDDHVGVYDAYGYTGNYSAYFGAVGDFNILSQDVVTTEGTSYDLSFRLDGSADGGGEIRILWGGESVFNSINAAYSWEQINLTGLIGQAGSTQLQFQFRNDPAYYYLDDVGGPVEASVPEPATLLLFGAGALLLGIRRLF
jgi:hypothetical protein